MIDYLKDALLYQEAEAGGKRYLLVHAGLGNFSKKKKFADYTIDELVWERPDYGRQYFEDRFVVTDHTPAQYIDINPKPGYIFQDRNHIAIDCGACHEDGRLARSTARLRFTSFRPGNQTIRIIIT